MTAVDEAPSELGSQREKFEIPPEVTFLNCANMSPQLCSVTQTGLAAVRSKVAPWTWTVSDWFSGAERLRGLFARVVNGDAEGVALVPGASYGIAVAAASVKVGRGQSIVLLQDEFPSNVYAWQELARRREGRIRVVPRSAERSWTEGVLEVIDADTAVVSVPNCHWTDGSLVDLVHVGERARAVGAAMVVDASQSIGAYPFDVGLVRPDFLVTVGYKWLLGPYGLAYMYVAPEWREAGNPIEYSWLSRAGSEDFSRLVEYTDAYQPGARRFDMGEYPQFVHAAMAAAALEQILEWGVDRIQGSLSALTLRAADAARAVGGSAPSPRERVGHMVGIRLAAGVPQGLGRSLADANVYVSLRGDSIRVAPHLYNDRADIDRFIEVLGILTSTGAVAGT